MAKKYLKDERGLVRAMTSQNLQLEKPLGSENYDIEVHNRNMDKIDEAIQDLRSKTDGLELKAEKVTIADKSDLFTSTNVEDALTELFQYANNGKKIIATAVGTPLVSSDTFSGLGSKIDVLLTRFRTVLQEKGQSSLSTDKLSALIEKIPNISQLSVEGIEKLPSWHKPTFHDTWVKANNMPTARMGLTSSVVNNMIYVIGGYNYLSSSFTYYNKNECYNSTSNTWSTKANIPTTRVDLTSSVVNNMIYVIGGYNYLSSGYTYYNKNECYNPTSNAWTTKANMPGVRAQLTSSVVNNMIYVIGGNDYSGSDIYNKNECYNPTSNAWTTKANMPTNRIGLASSVVNNKIYVMGGYVYDDKHIDANECYNPTSNTWTTMTKLPIAIDGLTSSSVGGKIYIIGGCHDDGVNNLLNLNKCYNPTSNTWTTKCGSPTIRVSHTSSVVNDNIYTIGGANTVDNCISSNEIYIV